MTRRPFLHILLSLLLLVSQQMGVTHAMSHWGAGRSAPQQLAKVGGVATSGVDKPIALDQPCDQCLAFAQIASAIGNANVVFAADDLAAFALSASAAQALCARTVCVFRSRAPPTVI